ncbi:MAG: hypothetical protein RQ899_06205, partial [Pseudomonadales bacterium]|nr:hypothetical protein [Pseudomonadales bacterium]
MLTSFSLYAQSGPAPVVAEASAASVDIRSASESLVASGNDLKPQMSMAQSPQPAAKAETSLATTATAQFDAMDPGACLVI